MDPFQPKVNVGGRQITFDFQTKQGLKPHNVQQDQIDHENGNKPTKKYKMDLSQRCIVMQNQYVYLFVQKANKQKQKIISDICDPISKPQNVHTFRLTDQSLLRASALGYTSQDVLDFLQQNVKSSHGISPIIQQKIRKFLSETQCPQMYLFTQGNESYYIFVISHQQKYKKGEIIKKIEALYLDKQIELEQYDNKKYLVKRVKKHQHNQVAKQLFQNDILLKAERIILPNKAQQITSKALRSKKPLNLCLDINISLKSFTQLREYQAAALNSVVSLKDNGLIAKSGYIVLPCGAGKTLLAISILSKIKKQTLIVCSSDSGTQQFKRQIQKWTQGFLRDQIIILTSSSEYVYKNSRTGQIFISTYSCLKSKLVREDIKMDNQWIRTKPWGLVIFDQCQTLPAQQNREIMNNLMAHVKIGLTATPLRQDDEIKSLTYMIGPQLYVGNWKTFVQMGFLANPKCIQIRTKLSKKFKNKYQEFIFKKDKRQLCYKVNPNKVKALLYLLEYHEKLKDNILIFCDDISLIRYLAPKLKKPILVGDTKNQERNVIFQLFRQQKVKTLFLSRIGDEAIDLPNANVAIQINILQGSRKQMLQRLGRIMRQKQASSLIAYNAIFYTIITAQTQEQKHFYKRSRCLIDEGFHYDLRLFQYSQRQDIDDIYGLDPQIKQIVEQKAKKIIGDEDRYWDAFIEAKSINNAV